ncbi:MAG: DUF1549 domain-containing protein, partial [Planctomycetaceae bacterium]
MSPRAVWAITLCGLALASTSSVSSALAQATSAETPAAPRDAAVENAAPAEKNPAASQPEPAASGLGDASGGTPADEAAKIEFFERQVRPLLIEKCFTCHSAETNSHGGLRVDDRQGLLTGGGRGPALVPGDPAASLLIKAIGREGPLKMPPQGELDEQQRAVLTRWIADGAAWTPVRIPSSLGERNEDYDHLRQTHWAWQPLTNPSPPAVANAAWSTEDLDRFILAKLEERGLPPVEPADPATLLRRVTHDLTGLPPTPEELAAFLADPSDAAYAQAIDRLLGSPRHAEHWARHWLDVARYGESTGSARNLPYPHAWRYR